MLDLELAESQSNGSWGPTNSPLGPLRTSTDPHLQLGGAPLQASELQLEAACQTCEIVDKAVAAVLPEAPLAAPPADKSKGPRLSAMEGVGASDVALATTVPPARPLVLERCALRLAWVRALVRSGREDLALSLCVRAVSR